MAKVNDNSDELVIAGTPIKRGERVTVDLMVAKLYTHTPLDIPIHIVRGRAAGPRVFISAAIHGDEINGVEIIRRVLKHSAIRKLKGDLIAIPVVNVYGFINHSRYLPDRRDLNRSFPGSDTGSLAARLANIFMTEIVNQCTHGIDLHTAASHRNNLPQIRANLDDPETERLAKAFGVPVILNSNLRDGSLREAAAELDMPMLLYEGGEALRFNEVAIRLGVRGILRVLRSLEMLPPRKNRSEDIKVALGTVVQKKSVLGVISEPLGQTETNVVSPYEGIVIAVSNLPLVNEGDAVIHIARFGDVEAVADQLESLQEMAIPEYSTIAPGEINNS
ncbi:MAG: succinylglutamate desuccinylase [Gammaproteobacteria bacterium SG8_15]|nr:MAG: succinylglutamate desuccinylase [Gammaproteobacteria bacterium SG8_15]